MLRQVGWPTGGAGPTGGRRAGAQGRLGLVGPTPGAPATGLAMAELLVDGESRTIDLSAFDPARFATGRKRRKPAKAGQEHVG